MAADPAKARMTASRRPMNAERLRIVNSRLNDSAKSVNPQSRQLTEVVSAALLQSRRKPARHRASGIPHGNDGNSRKQRQESHGRGASDVTARRQEQCADTASSRLVHRNNYNDRACARQCRQCLRRSQRVAILTCKSTLARTPAGRQSTVCSRHCLRLASRTHRLTAMAGVTCPTRAGDQPL